MNVSKVGTLCPFSVARRQGRHPAFLAATWCCGLLAGAIIARVFRTRLTPIFQSCVSYGAVCALGQVLCAGVLQWVFPAGIPLAAFCSGAALSYTAQGIRAGFGSAGWVLWPLFLFPRLLLSPFLYFAWLQSGGRRCRLGYLLAAAAAVAAGLAEFCLVIPFGAFLIE